MMNKKKFIAVIGGSECSPQEAELAEEVGRELARQGAFLICGGLGGIMAAVCKGASSEGGVTIGILPGGSRHTANPYVQIPIVTNLGEARNVVLVKSAEAVIAIGGGYGTLSEIGHALRNGIPVVGLNTWSLSRNDQSDDSIILAQDPAEAVKKAIGSIKNE
jgi:uncharacterized protein (TIGR00725 family)